MKRTFRLFLSAIAIFIATNLSAQVTTSSISGTVKDEKGIALEGATVKATHIPSGSIYYNYVQKGGNFSIPGMKAGGPYTVEITFVGYNPEKIEGLNLNLGDDYVINATLKDELVELAGASVSGEARKSVQTTGLGKSFSTRDITNVPTITRSMNDIITLTPQAYVSSGGANIGGGNYRQSFVTVDGAAFNNAFGIGQNLPASGSPISLDALDQISVNITPYDVRQSGFTGASINAVTRSGDNEFRGSTYFYYNNESFKGNKVGDIKLNRLDSKYRMFGVRLGGPILKNKLFFFVSYEKENSVEPGPSRVAATASKPYTNGKDGVARPTETQMNTIRDYLINTYKYNPGDYQGYSSKSPGEKLLARLDWNINRDHKLNFRYTRTRSKNPSAPSTSTGGLAIRDFTINNRQAPTAIYFQNARYYQEQNFDSFAGELNSRLFDGKLNNTLRYSYSHQDEPRSTDGGEFPFVDICEDGNILTSFGTELFSYGNLRDVKTTNITDELSFQIGEHKLLAGVQYEHNITKNGFQRFGSGYYQFNSWDDFVNKKPNQFAITHSFNSDFSQSFPTFKYNQYSFYLQDEFSVDEILKITLGLRGELPKYPDLNTFNKQVADTDLGTTDVNSDATMRYRTDQLPKSRLMWSPRIGFSLDILKDRILVLRGGTGLFTGRIPFVWIIAQASDSGVLQNTYTATVKDGNIIPKFTSDRIEMLKEIYPSGITAKTVSLSQASLIDRDLKMPQSWKTFLALDAKLPDKLNLSLEGIYSKDINPAVVLNVGLKPGVSTAIPGYDDQRLYYGKNYDSKLRNAYLLTNSKNSGYYYSLTLKADKRFNFGLNASIAYTYSGAKNVTDGVGDQIGSAYYSSFTKNGVNQQNLGYASYVMPHRLIGTISYRKEYLKNFATTISLIYEGGPKGRMSYTYTTNVVGDGASYNLIYVPKTKDELTFADYKYKDSKGTNQTYTAAQQAEDFWNFINNNKYLRNRKGQYAQRNGAIYPWINTFDLKIAQDFYINVGGKRNTIQLGLDILNVGNLLNSKWGAKQSFTETAVLKQTNKLGQGSTDKPIYNFMRNGTEVLNDAFAKTIGFSSTYSMQFSIRYIFN